MKGFIGELAKIVPMALGNPTHSAWKGLTDQITQEVLDDAHSHSIDAQNLFESIGTLESRSKKQQSRILKKIAEVDSRDKHFFKVVSDFIAFRVPCKVNEITQILSEIERITLENNGCYWVKGSCKREDGTYTDIIQYIYVYVPRLLYVIEFQVGHPFAAYTFKVDSALRDDPNCGLVDLWKDNVYSKVKQWLLDCANGKEASGQMHDAWDAVYTLHEGKIPNELHSALEYKI